MPRKSLADRLQTGFETVPLDKRTPEQFEASLPGGRWSGRNTKPWVGSSA